MMTFISTSPINIELQTNIPETIRVVPEHMNLLPYMAMELIQPNFLCTCSWLGCKTGAALSEEGGHCHQSALSYTHLIRTIFAN
jgi:hypothetical protein